ncbi:MAG TPA: hypothetical protein VF342_14025 [Alphaproteobacteria bacterium]
MTGILVACVARGAACGAAPQRAGSGCAHDRACRLHRPYGRRARYAVGAVIYGMAAAQIVSSALSM